MTTYSQALQRASATSHWLVGMCDNFVANMWGYSSSGYPTAIAHWNSIPSSQRHPGDLNAPAGSLVFFQTSNPDGHVALADGQGNVYSTDISGPGTVSKVPITDMFTKWHATYLGWTPPIFQGQTGGSTGAANASYTPVGNPLTGGGSALDFLTSGFGSDIKDISERAGLIILGGILILVGLWRLTGKSIDDVIFAPRKATKSSLGEGRKAVKETADALPNT